MLLSKNELLKPVELWKFVDSVFDDVKEWVYYNKKDINYECCGQASEIFYKLLIDWGIGKYPMYKKGEIDIDDVIKIAVGAIRGIEHVWVEIFNGIYDPTKMQFKSDVSVDEYTMGFHYNDYSDDCEEVFKDEDIAILCRAIRPDIYYDDVKKK